MALKKEVKERRAINRYFQNTKLWKMYKTPEKKAHVKTGIGVMFDLPPAEPYCSHITLFDDSGLRLLVNCYPVAVDFDAGTFLDDEGRFDNPAYAEIGYTFDQTLQYFKEGHNGLPKAPEQVETNG